MPGTRATLEAPDAVLNRCTAGAASNGPWHRSGELRPWLLSLLVHGVAFVGLGMSVPRDPQGAAPTAIRVIGIALAAGELRRADDRSHGEAPTFVAAASYTAPVEQPPPLAESTQAPEPSSPLEPAPLKPALLLEPPPLLESSLANAPPPTFPGPRLPTLSSAELAAVALPAALPGEADAAQAVHLAAVSPGGEKQHGAETQVFGVTGRGNTFVYVFDCSSSMEGPPLVAAKRELIASLHSLDRIHRFQIVFYNQQPHSMPVRGRQGQLALADERSKELAARFVGGISAFGATDHMQALRLALALKPDVIFFLTDADEPQLTHAEFVQLRGLNHGTSINTIEFGLGEPKPRFNFLMQLSAEHGGQHVYVDVSRLPR